MKKIIKKIIPRFVFDRLQALRAQPLFTRSYAQEGEDMILRRIFEGKKSGFYVDIGAHHPVRFSNTYHFYKLGWRGINIDAMPGSMEKFNKVRPFDVNIEVPIYSKDIELDYYIFNDTALNGFSKNLSEERIKLNYKILDVKKLKTSTLDKILEKNLPKDIKEIDFFSIDVEGVDLEVLKSNNWEKYSPKFVLIEILNSNIDDVLNSEIFIFLKDKNYEVFAKSFQTIFFKRKI